MRRSASMPSRSGRPRSSRTASGRRSATRRRPSSAVGHSTTSSERARRLVRSARRNDVSSSITSTVVIVFRSLPPRSCCRRALLRAGSGHDEDECRAAPWRLLAPYVAAVRGHERVDDREPEPGTGGIRASIHPYELLEDALALGLGHTGAVVGDPHHHTDWVVAGARRDQDLRARWREAQSVLEQVAEDLFHHLDIDVDVAEVGGDVESDPVRARQRAEPPDGGLREVAHVDRLAPDVERARAYAAELQ